MAMKSPLISADSKQTQSNKRLLLMLLIAAILTVWSLLKNEEDADKIELTNPKVIADKSLLTTDAITPENVNKKSLYKETLRSTQYLRVDEQQALNSAHAIEWQKLQREPLSTHPRDVFKVHSWLVIPKPIKTKPIPPPPPVAPPAPFTYMGKLENSPQGMQIFLLRNGHLYTAVKGQKIDAQWRLDAEDMDNIQLTYLPLNLPQVLSKSTKSFEPDGQPAMADSPTATEMNL